MRDYLIGIDFGTTNTSVVGIYNDEKGQSIFPLKEDNKYPFSSIVAIPKNGDNELKFGRKVRENRLELSQDNEIYTSMKSYLGTDKEFLIGGIRYTPTDITTSFLKYIKEYILKTKDIDIKEAAFSFPVDFSPEARRELRKAAIDAGIKPRVFVSEATAAYLSARKDAKAYSKVMVIDWGGGTLDTCVLDLKKDSVYEASVSGIKIGGDDIDLELAKCVHSKIVQMSKLNDAKSFDEMSPSEKDALISYCEKAKIEFSDFDDDYIITVRNYGMYGTKNITLTYNTFSDIVEVIIKNKILKSINEALMKAEISSSNVDAVILVGGSTNIRPFINAISNIFGEEKIIMPEKAQWAVATGTAYMQIIGNNFFLNDTLGVLLSDNTIYPLLEKNKHGVGTVIKDISFGLVSDSQNAYFNFMNEEKNITYGKLSVPTKGFLRENLKVSASIGTDQIARIRVSNDFMGSDCAKELEVNKLTFHYDLNAINHD